MGTPNKPSPENPSIETLLAEKRVDAWLLCLPETTDDRDDTFLRLDWRFRGAIARALQIGAISNRSGEVSLLPCTRLVGDHRHETYRILSLGVKDRANVTSHEIDALVRNVQSLGLKSVGLSASDFGWSHAEAKKAIARQGVNLCVTE